jgi:hypothetical protein
MAFTATEKRQIRSYLGYSGGFRDRGVRLESMMTVVGDQTEEAAYARTILTSLAAVDTAIAASGVSSSTATYGSLKQVDEVQFYPVTDSSSSASSATLSGVAYGEVLIERLRALFDVPLNGRYYRTGMFNSEPFPLG